MCQNQEQGSYNDFPIFIGGSFNESFNDIDSSICVKLSNTNVEYMDAGKELNRLWEAFPIITKLEGGDGEICLTAEEHSAFNLCENLILDRERIEREELYLRGHADAFAYLKRIGVI